MTIILPQPPPDRVWVHSPTWLFAGYHWAIALALGILMLAIAMLARRAHDDENTPRSPALAYSTGLLLVLSLAPLALGLLGAFGSMLFSQHPAPSTSDQTWSPTRDLNHDFEIDSAKVIDSYTAPPRDIPAEIRNVNAAIQKYSGMTPLHATTMPSVTKSTDGDEQLDLARKASPFLVNGEVYTCAFIADALTHSKSGDIEYAKITSATCVQGGKSITVTIK